jgi:hypothetical protein
MTISLFGKEKSVFRKKIRYEDMRFHENISFMKGEKGKRRKKTYL